MYGKLVICFFIHYFKINDLDIKVKWSQHLNCNLNIFQTV